MMNFPSPGLSRAVAQVTQPYGPPPSSEVMRSFQAYMSDPASVDMVYQALVSRAWAEPHSAAVVDKVVALLKQGLLRHTPSAPVLDLVNEFCVKISEAMPVQPAGAKAIHYVQTCIEKLNRQRGKIGPGPAGNSIHHSSPTQLQPTPRVGPGGTWNAHLAHLTSSVSPSKSNSNHTAVVKYISNLGPPKPGVDITADGDLLLASQPEGLPPWSVSTALERAMMPNPSMANRRPSLEWSARLPAFTTQLSHYRPIQRSAAEASPRAPPITLSTVVRYVLDVDESDIPRHLEEISDSCKAEAVQGQMDVHLARHTPPRTLYTHQPYDEQEALVVQDAELAAVVAVVCGPGAHADVAGGTAGLEDLWMHFDRAGLGQVCGGIFTKLIMDLWLKCGPGSAYPLLLRLLRQALNGSAASVRARAFDVMYNLAVHAALVRDTPHAQTPNTPFGGGGGGGGSSALNNGASAANGVNGLGEAFGSSLGSPQASVMPGSANGPRRSVPGSPQHQATASLDEQALYGSTLRSSPRVSSRPSSRTPSRPSSAGARTPRRTDDGLAGEDSSQQTLLVHVQMQRWLRAMLFQLMLDICEKAEYSELVWQSALGCMLQLTVHGGHFVASWVEHLPTKALSGLLRACVRFGWSQELYCHLLQLTSLLLLQPGDGSSASSAVAAGAAASAGSADDNYQDAADQGDAPNFSQETINFGGLEEVLYHFSRAPTPDSRACMVALLVQYLTPPGPGNASTLLSALHSLHLPTVALALQTALHCPRPGMAQDLAAALLEGSPAMEAARLLLSEFLVQFEALCLQSMSSRTADELSSPMEATLAHISGSVHHMEWRTLDAGWASFKNCCTVEDLETRQWAIHWLHQAVLRGVQACGGNPLLLSPAGITTLRPEDTPTTPGQKHWSEALAEVLLLVVAEAPLGCELLLASVLRVVADLRHQFAARGAYAAVARPAMASYHTALLWMQKCGVVEHSLPAILDLTDLVLTAISEPQDPNGYSSAGGHSGYNSTGYSSGPPGLGASSQHLGQLPQGQQQAAAYSPGMNGHAVNHVAGGYLQQQQQQQQVFSRSSWVVSGSMDRGGGGNSPSSTPHMQPGHGHTRTTSSTGQEGGNLSALGSFNASNFTNLRSSGAQQPQQLLASSSSQPQLEQQQPTSPGGRARSASGQHIATSLISGTAAFSPDVIASTPPELLVCLLQQCSLQPGQGYGNMSRGFAGRPRGAADEEDVQPSSRVGICDGPWQDVSQDRRLAVMLALMARCALDPHAFAKHNLSGIIKAQLGCEDVRGRYYAGVYLLKHWMLNQQDKYWRALRQLILQAQQLNDERLLSNPFLQMCSMLNVDHTT